MAKTKHRSASFMLRFTQKIFQDENEEAQVQWRGNIRHVQGGDEKRFTEVESAISFIQEKLKELTLEATENKTKEERDGILTKSFNIWKKVAQDGSKLVLETIKDPKKGVSQIQNQIQGQFENVKEELGQRIDLDPWIASSKEDYQNIMGKLDSLTDEISTLSKKVEKLRKSKK